MIKNRPAAPTATNKIHEAHKITRRWCCDILKPWHGKQNQIPLKHRIMGIRAEESPKRKQRGRINFDKNSKHTLYSPIFFFTEGDVWEYIEKYALKYSSLYNEGFDRIGCVVCPFLSKRKVEMHRQRWPQFYRLLDIYLNKLWQKNKDKLQDDYFTYEEIMRWPLWKSKAMRKQMGLFTQKGDK